MATLIPAFSTCSQRMTNGERRLAQRLQEKLEDDYLLWYDVPVGVKCDRYPDFIILHPQRGLIILEVKDWKLDTILEANPAHYTILTPRGPVKVRHPVQQAKEYAFALTQKLQQDPLLVQHTGSHKGSLIFSYSYGAVLTNITRKQLEAHEGLRKTIRDNLVICQDEFVPSVDPMHFQQRLWGLCTYQFGPELSQAEIDRIRWHIFPEVRINLPAPPAEEGAAEVIPDILRVMDLQQEQLARSLGVGHRVIHGVAGSGKTLILVYRCIYLLEQTQKPILVLCFNKALAAKLRQMLSEKGVGGDRVIIRNFHKWCHDLLWQYRVPKPGGNQYRGSAYFDELVRRVAEALDAGKIPPEQYGAIMIDEGHDFEPQWFQLVVRMVDATSDSLLVMYDDAQTIYEKRGRRKFSFQSVGVQARGRTTILKVNYRNTAEVLAVAYEFAKELMSPAAGADDDGPVLVQPESAGRHGPMPQLIKLPTLKAEAAYLVKQAQRLHEEGHSWNDIAIIYRSSFIAKEVQKQFQQAQIPLEWITEPDARKEYTPTEQSVKLVTMHSSKGLEFPIIFIPGVGFLPNQYGTPEDETRLMYVAMTRATDHLLMTCDRPSEFAKKIKAVLFKDGQSDVSDG